MKNFSPVERIKTTVKLQEPDVVPVALSFSASTTQAFAQMSPEDFFSGPWRVIDLGVDVSPEQFIAAAEKVSADIIAVGVYVRLGWEHALNLTKMVKERQLPFKTLAGGKGFKRAEEALEAGFDAFADDGFEAVKMADQLIAGKA